MPRKSEKPPFEQKWKELADKTRGEAMDLPPGRARDEMLKKARQLETACHMSEWISSPGLRPPVDTTE
jgi:hypothetical protein